MISSEVKTGPVGRFSRREAFRLLAADSGANWASRADVLARLYRRHRGDAGAMLWHARQGRRTVAAAMIVPNPGRFGMVLFSRFGAPGVDPSALATLLGRLWAAGCDSGLAFVQALVPVEARGDVAVLETAGLEKLAELVYMRLNLIEAACASESALGACDDWTWRACEQFDEAELCDVIARTYAGSLDCPALTGVRSISDVVAGHKASGTFCPASWWIVERGGRPAGCILINGSASPCVAEVVYVGVVPAFRGQGLARAMLAHAAREARRQKNCAMTLAVDACNAPARGVYESAGFTRIFSRVAYTSPLHPPSQQALVDEM